MRFLLAVLLISVFSVAEAQQTTAVVAENSGPDFRKEVEKETFLLVNDYRTKNDLPPLAWSDDMAKIARSHSKDMATGDVDFGHDGFSDRVGQMKDLMPGFRGAGENVLMSDQLDDIAHTAVALWLKSPHHLKNIRGDYNYSGIGVWQDKNGVIYFTQIFLKAVPPVQETQTQSPTPEMTTLGLLASPYTRAGH
jgi:uncharacterized protein YkwD